MKTTKPVKDSKKNMRYMFLSFMLVLILSTSLFGSLYAKTHYAYAQQSYSVVADLAPSDDAYVVVDVNDQADKQGFAGLNTGDYKFLKVFYAWNVTASGKERIISVAYLKFDLSKINPDSAQSASLKLYPFIENLTGLSRPVDVYAVSNDAWKESTIVFHNAPKVIASQNTTAYVSEINKYVSWDITNLVKSHSGSSLTLAITFKNTYMHSQEQVVFYSKEADDPTKRPKLELTLSPGTSPPSVGNGISKLGDNNVLTSGPSYISSAVIISIIIGSVSVGYVVMKKKKSNHKTSLNNSMSLQNCLMISMMVFTAASIYMPFHAFGVPWDNLSINLSNTSPQLTNIVGISGTITESNTTPYTGSATISITSPGDTYYTTFTTALDASGNYNTNWTVPSNAVGGTYVVQVKGDSVNTGPIIDSKTLTVTATLPSNQQSIPNSQTSVTMSASTPVLVVGTAPTLTTVVIPTGVVNPQINYATLVSGSDPSTVNTVNIGSSTLTITNSGLSNMQVVIPAGTVIAGTGWTGILNLPATSSVSVTPPAGTNIVSSIEIGSGSTPLTLTGHAVQLTFPNAAGDRVVYQRGSGPSTEITTICTDNTQGTNDGLPAGGDCKINVGTSLIVWTKHFTTFSTAAATRVSGSGCPDCIPPVLSGSAFSSSEHGLTISGSSFDLSSFTNTVPTTTIKTGTPLSIKLLIYDNDGPDTIQHVGLFTNLNGLPPEVYNSDTYISFDKGKPLDIIDPHGLFSNVNITTTNQGNKLQLSYLITFAKPMAQSDIIIRVWDDYQNNRDTKVSNALLVQGNTTPQPATPSTPQPSQTTDSSKYTDQKEMSIVLEMIKQWEQVSLHKTEKH